MCTQHAVLRQRLFRMVYPTLSQRTEADSSDHPVPQDDGSKALQELLLDRLAGMIEGLTKTLKEDQATLLVKANGLEAVVNDLSRTITAQGERVTAAEDRTQSAEGLLQKIAELTSECARLLNVFNNFVMLVVTQAIPLSSDTADDLWKVPMVDAEPLAAHSGDRTLTYEVLDNAAQPVGKAEWSTLPYAEGFPDAKKVSPALMNKYRSAVQKECITRQAAARSPEDDPDVVIPTVDMSDIEFPRLVLNSKGIVVDVLWPKIPLIEGPHNDPVPRVPAHGGRRAHFSDDAPTFLPPLTGRRWPTGTMTPPTVARYEAGAAAVTATTEVIPGGLQGRTSGNGTDLGSHPDSSILLRRMDELVSQVQSQKRALEQMYDTRAGQEYPKKKAGTMLLKDSIATILALSGQDEAPLGSSVIYQQTLAPLPKWTGKETDKIRDGAKWIRTALRQAKRTHIHFIEFLEDNVDGPGQAWAEGLSREHAKFTLQQAQINSGDLLVLDGQASLLGKPVTLALPVTEVSVLESFHASFLHNKVSQVQASQVSLFGGAMSQSPKEPLADFLLRFKAKVWDANLILEDSPAQMISLLYHGLLPYLRQHGFNNRKTSVMFLTFAEYEEFLTEKESTVIRMRDFAHFQVTTPAPPTPMRVAPLLDAEPAYDLQDDYYLDEYFDKEEEEYYSGMLNALGTGPRRSTQQKPKPSAAQVVSIPGKTPGSKPIEVRKRDIAFYLRFADDSADWPLNGTPFAGALKDNTVAGSRPSHREQVTQLMKFLRPSIQDATCTGVFDTAKAHNRDWVWCILHGSTHHHTHMCPCLLKAFPARTKLYDRNKQEYKQQVNVMRRQGGDYSGEDEE
jgi:hypothetical protein